MAPESDTIVELLDAKKFIDAEILLNDQIRKVPENRRLQILAFQLYKSTNRPKRALEIAQKIIQLDPNDWKGYALVARCLDEQQSTEEAIKALKQGLDKHPKNRRLLAIARRLYTKAGDEKKRLKYSLKLAELCPKKIGLQVETAHKLACLGKIKKARKILTKALFSSPGNKQLTQLEARLNHYISSNQRKYNQQQIPPLICIAGNCQIQPITEWLKESFPFSEIKCLEPYHLIEHQSTIDQWLEDIKKADIIFMIPVNEGFNGFHFGSKKASQERRKKSLFISYPSFHFEAFYPLFGYAKTKAGKTLRGEDLQSSGHLYDDYHDFLAMQLSKESDDKIEQFFHAIHLTEKDHYKGSMVIHKVAVSSFLQFSKRYPQYTDILQSNIKAGIGHTFNHPGNQFLEQMYSKIWTEALNFNPEDYITYTKDPLNNLQLPIPSFVTRSLTSPQFQHPWDAPADIEARTSLQNYVLQIRTSIDVYRANPDILDHNQSHPKLAHAKDFINEAMQEASFFVAT